MLEVAGACNNDVVRVHLEDIFHGVLVTKTAAGNCFRCDILCNTIKDFGVVGVVAEHAYRVAVNFGYIDDRDLVVSNLFHVLLVHLDNTAGVVSKLLTALFLSEHFT